MIDAKIKCVAPWAGGKRTLAPKIVDLLGPHDSYFEPFVGGCSILPQKPVCPGTNYSRSEFLNDANPKIHNVLTCVRDFPNQIEYSLEGIEFTREHFDSVKCAKLLSDLGPGAAAKQLALWWMGANGFAGTTKEGWFAQRHTKTGGDPAKRWQSFKESIPALSARLKGTVITNADWVDFLSLPSDTPNTAIYCDPPYLSKTFKYEFDFVAVEHERLAVILNEFRESRIVVSYRIANSEEDEYLTRLYSPNRWRKIEANVSKNMASASGTAKRNTEVLLVNDGH